MKSSRVIGGWWCTRNRGRGVYEGWGCGAGGCGQIRVWYGMENTTFPVSVFLSQPENIMVDLPSENLKIIDYGASRHSGDVDEVLSQGFETCSNYEYVAPEIFQQVPVGPGTDVWGVGLIIYTMYVQL